MTHMIKIISLSMVLFGAFFLAGCGSGNDSAPGNTVNDSASGNTVNDPPVPAKIGVSKTASLSGGEEVPPVATSAAGSGIFELDAATGAVSGRVTISTAPTSTITAVHVHEGARGVNGSIVIRLNSAGSNVWSIPTGIVLSPTQLDLFSTGNFYFNIRTDDHPMGELRGQIDG